jgi:hypothetical protein
MTSSEYICFQSFYRIQIHLFYEPYTARLCNTKSFLFSVIRGTRISESVAIVNQVIKGIVSRDCGTLFLFHWIDLKVVIGPDKVNFSF